MYGSNAWFKTRSTRSTRTIVVFMQADMLSSILLLPKIWAKVYICSLQCDNMAVIDESITPDKSDDEDGD